MERMPVSADCTPNNSRHRPVAAVRIEGGLGDHILAMRLLRFIKERFPAHRIEVYSDCEGGLPQLKVLSMSPGPDRIRPVYKRPGWTKENMSNLSTLQEIYIDEMTSADVFIDANLSSLFLPHAPLLDVPIFTILGSFPQLEIPQSARDAARGLFEDDPPRHLIAINLSKYGLRFWEAHRDSLYFMLDSLLSHAAVHIANIFSLIPSYAHWPEYERSQRERFASDEVEFIRTLDRYDPRIINIVDHDIMTVAAILARSTYFVGVDNGVKHLAWALRVPHSVILPAGPAFDHPSALPFVLRWIPDFHRSLLLNDPTSVRRHLDSIATLLQRGGYAETLGGTG